VAQEACGVQRGQFGDGAAGVLPAYHRKCNPVERVFGVLENYWSGDPLLTIEHALGMARNMTYKGVHPVTSLHPGGEKGVKVAKAEMRVLSLALDRLEGLGKWFVKFTPEKASEALSVLERANSRF